jgi:uncharacterized surface protein with fasciclin (FAS1) repeats
MRIVVLAMCAALAACGGGEGGNEAEADNRASAAAGEDGKSAAKTSLLDSLKGSTDHATLAKAVSAAGLDRTLSGAQPYTLFAPTEAAFQKLPAGTLDGLLAAEGKGALTVLLTNHIVPGTVTAEDLSRAVERGKGKAQLATVGGANLSFAKQGDALVITGADGKAVNVAAAVGPAAANGVLHSIDGVLAPQ